MDVESSAGRVQPISIPSPANPELDPLEQHCLVLESSSKVQPISVPKPEPEPLEEQCSRDLDDHDPTARLHQSYIKALQEMEKQRRSQGSGQSCEARFGCWTQAKKVAAPAVSLEVDAANFVPPVSFTVVNCGQSTLCTSIHQTGPVLKFNDNTNCDGHRQVAHHQVASSFPTRKDRERSFSTTFIKQGG